MRFIELFAGIGGFRFALQNLGNECVWANEIDKYASQVYRKNYGMGELYEGDITKVKSEDIPSHDLLVGGFPCQAFSIAGKRGGFDDTRGTLFFEVARILKHHRPSCVLLENVKGLLTHDSGKTFQTILKVLTDLGYRVEWQVLNSKHFGVPQNRERIFIVGYLRGSSRSQVFPIRANDERDLQVELHREETNEGRGVEDTQGGGRCSLLRGRPRMPYEPGKRELNYKRYDDTCPTLTENCASGDQKNIVVPRAVLTPMRPKKRQNGRRMKDEGDPMFTLTSQDIHGVAILPKVRRLTPIECERLQGFPDNWTQGVSDTQRYKCLGNAVTTNVIAAIGRRIT